MWLRAAKGLVNLRASSYQPSMRDNATRATNVCAVLFRNACIHSKTCLKRPLKTKTKIFFQDRVSLNAGQKYCRMLQGGAFCNTFDLH